MSIVPYGDDSRPGSFSIGDTVAFWEHLYKKGQLIGVLIYILSALLFFTVLAYLVQGLFDKALGSYSIPLITFTLIIFMMFVFIFPSMPRLYRVQFKGKLRTDIPEEELNGLLIEMTGKSLELAAIIIDVICLLCIAIFEIAEFLSLPDTVTSILLAATALDTFLASLVLASIGRSNRYYARKIHIKEEYRRFTSLGNYKRIYAILIIVNVLAVTLLFLVW
jgi:hypothetical protein